MNFVRCLAVVLLAISAGCAVDRSAIWPLGSTHADEESGEYETPKMQNFLHQVFRWDDGSEPKTEEELEYDQKFRNNG